MPPSLRISARVENRRGTHDVTLRTNEQMRALDVAPRTTGFGSSANGGERLALALATCYCNDLYRESERDGVRVDGVTVDVATEFGGAGEPARRITYRACILSDAPEDAVRRLAAHTDRVAEVHNTLRLGMPGDARAGGRRVRDCVAAAPAHDDLARPRVRARMRPEP